MSQEIRNLDEWIKEKIALTTLTRENLKEYQFECLKKTINQALKTRFYREKLKNFPIESLQTIEDIGDLPLTDAAELKKAPMDFLAVSQRKVKKIVTLNSSGTTGPVKRVFFTEKDIELTTDFFKNGMGIFTGPGDRVLVLLPGKTPASIGDLLKKALGRLGAEALIYGVVDDPQKVSKLILSEKITGIVGIPHQVLAVSKQKEAEQIRSQGCLKNVLLSTDYVSPSLSKQLNENWGIEVYEHYGSTEMGYGGGVFCSWKKGYHLREADFYFEIIDPKTKAVLPDGAFGEVVFTTLTREAMPLLRYRTGDYGRFLKEGCHCKTPLKSLERITDRMKNRVLLENGLELVLSQIEDLVFKEKSVCDYELALEDSEDGETMVCLKLIFEEEKSDDAVLEKVQKNLKEGLNDSVPICVSEGNSPEIDIKGLKKHQIINRRSKNG